VAYPKGVLSWLALAGVGVHTAAHPQSGATLPPVEVIGTSPLPGQGVDRNTLPYATQVVPRQALEAAQADNVTDHLARRVPGVQINDIQGSPFQGDLTFRGYRASGLLGAAQGLSVYLDGVRVNEPFGDVVNWDLIPEFSLDSLSLVPGANPAFGLNTLGGSLSLRTADGFTAPGWRGEVSVGSFGRKRVDLSQGGEHADGWQHYVAVGGFDEDGWRDHSEGRLGHLLAKVGRRTDLGEFSLNLLHGRSKLIGNGLVPLYTLDDDGERAPDLGSRRNEAVYTHPDLTRNRVTQTSANWRQELDGGMTLEALAYLRHTRRQTINGDEADDDEDGTSEANASFNRTATRQRGAGVSTALSGHLGEHQWQVGASADHARVNYEQTEQEGVFDDTRGVVPLDGPAELSARVKGSTRSFGIYATDTWQVASRTHLTGTLRFNQARVGNKLDSVDDDSGELESHSRESFRYRSWNPAIGVAHRLEAGPTLFANVARNNRVPTVIELGCADPDEPCRLPAGLQADPYLKQVVSTSVEGGVRFGRTGGTRGSVTLYRINNRDDILFSSVSVTGQLGFFRNFPRTRHQGVDAELKTTLGPVDLGMGYSYLEATYEARGTLRMGERNVEVRPGIRIAGLPRHILKLSADWTVMPGLTLGTDLQALSGRVVAGNEDGRIENDEDERVDLSLPGYAVVNLRGAWKPAGPKGIELFARVTNLFDRRYASYGALAETQFDAQGNYTGEARDAVFVAPGAPRAFAAGMRVRF
jgi:outer membrane receptor protein involved in Fe transport